MREIWLNALGIGEAGEERRLSVYKKGKSWYTINLPPTRLRACETGRSWQLYCITVCAEKNSAA
jgi:hypothetical protein